MKCSIQRRTPTRRKPFSVSFCTASSSDFRVNKCTPGRGETGARKSVCIFVSSAELSAGWRRKTLVKYVHNVIRRCWRTHTDFFSCYASLLLQSKFSAFLISRLSFDLRMQSSHNSSCVAVDKVSLTCCGFHCK